MNFLGEEKEKEMNWKCTRTLVTGGASFIGSTLVDSLLERGAQVRVVDNFSSGRRENLAPHLKANAIELMAADLLDDGVARKAVRGMDLVFHLAADHGGRGYVDLHQAACASNLGLDGLLFRACVQESVEKVVFASSGCVYPNYIQKDPSEILYLTEDKAGPPYDADNLYGWAKLMAEMTLQAYHRDYGIKAASCRYFTVYGPRGHENHAVIAMIARAFIGQNPFVVWGNGEQIRNWTHVDDIVSGTIGTAEVIDDGTAINLGTMERTRVIDAVHEVLRYTGHKAEIELHPEMPTGPLNRVADNSLAKRLLKWEPQVQFMEGLKRAIDWYFSTKDRSKVAAELESLLTERQAAEKETRGPRKKSSQKQTGHEEQGVAPTRA
jgi:nucleoside-diphosphate-sugar epimerase